MSGLAGPVGTRSSAGQQTHKPADTSPRRRRPLASIPPTDSSIIEQPTGHDRWIRSQRALMDQRPPIGRSNRTRGSKRKLINGDTWPLCRCRASFYRDNNEQMRKWKEWKNPIGSASPWRRPTETEWAGPAHQRRQQLIK